jgi:Tol biopolymer transport system component
VPLSPGLRLGPYEIVGPIGAGGMGEVYRARDTRLERAVAVKILPAHAAADPEFKARFEREAKTISQLNHPNICVVHDVGEQDGTSFLVMELLEGETLAARLQKGALPTEDVLRIAGEIADALDKAHRKGIIHRDLKPANVMLTPTGSKLLDFGLAKPGVSVGTLETQLARSSELNPPTPGAASPPPLTTRGTILGTFQYMAPEQVEGDLADARTDIWAFGCLLYEMVTGRRAFEGKSQASLIASILERHPPPMSELQPMTPPALGRIVRTCLAKSPDDRFQTAHDLALQLEWLEEGGSALGLPAPVIASRRQRERMIFAAIALGVGVAGAATAWLVKPVPAAPPGVVGRFMELLPEDQALTRPGRRSLAISPDGTRVVYIANQQIYLRKLNESQVAAIPGTLTNPAEPVFSPEGESIAFWSNGSGNAGDLGGKIWRVPLTGGTPSPVCDATNPYGMSWTGSIIYFGQRTAIMSVPATGGTPTELVKADQTKGEQVGHPQITSDGAYLIFVVNTALRNWDTSQIVAQRLGTGERRVLVSGGTSPRLLKSGHLAFIRESTVFAQAFDEQTATVRGTAVPMVQRTGYAGFSGAGHFSVSETGTLAMIEGSGDDLLTLTWIDRAGKTEPVANAPKRRHFEPRLSPDGTMIATATRDDSPDIYVWDLRRGVEARVTRDEVRDVSPVWLDNRELLFGMDADNIGTLDLVRRRADLTTERTVVSATPDSEAPMAVSRDGKTVVVTAYPSGVPHIASVSLDKPGAPVALLGASYPSANASISPDGRWLAYDAREGERNEVYVRPYPNVNDARQQISQGGGNWPAWSRDGKELYYVGNVGGQADRPFMAVPVRTAGTTFDWSPGVRLFSMAPYMRSAQRGYDVFLDSTRFLVVSDADAPSAVTRTVMRYVTNWFEELRARVK